jgi:hypothetical protein
MWLAVPEHVPFPKKLYVTVPVGVKPDTPVTVAASYAFAPVTSFPDQVLLLSASFTVVPVELEYFKITFASPAVGPAIGWVPAPEVTEQFVTEPEQKSDPPPPPPEGRKPAPPPPPPPPPP